MSFESLGISIKSDILGDCEGKKFENLFGLCWVCFFFAVVETDWNRWKKLISPLPQCNIPLYESLFHPQKEILLTRTAFCMNSCLQLRVFTWRLWQRMRGYWQLRDVAECEPGLCQLPDQRLHLLVLLPDVLWKLRDEHEQVRATGSWERLLHQTRLVTQKGSSLRVFAQMIPVFTLGGTKHENAHAIDSK